MVADTRIDELILAVHRGLKDYQLAPQGSRLTTYMFDGISIPLVYFAWICGKAEVFERACALYCQAFQELFKEKPEKLLKDMQKYRKLAVLFGIPCLRSVKKAAAELIRFFVRQGHWELLAFPDERAALWALTQVHDLLEVESVVLILRRISPKKGEAALGILRCLKQFARHNVPLEKAQMAIGLLREILAEYPNVAFNSTYVETWGRLGGLGELGRSYRDQFVAVGLLHTDTTSLANLTASHWLPDDNLLAFYRLPTVAPMVAEIASCCLSIGIDRGRGEAFVLHMLQLFGTSITHGEETIVAKALANPEYSDLTVAKIADRQGPLGKVVCVDDVLRLPFPRSDGLIIRLLNRGATVTKVWLRQLEGHSEELRKVIGSHLMTYL